MTSYIVQVSNDTYTWHPCRNGTEEAVGAPREHPWAGVVGVGDTLAPPAHPASQAEQGHVGVNCAGWRQAVTELCCLWPPHPPASSSTSLGTGHKGCLSPAADPVTCQAPLVHTCEHGKGVHGCAWHSQLCPKANTAAWCMGVCVRALHMQCHACVQGQSKFWGSLRQG